MDGNAQKPIDIFDPLPFGKYKGELAGTVAENDPEYLAWLIHGEPNLRVTKDLLDYLEECR